MMLLWGKRKKEHDDRLKAMEDSLETLRKENAELAKKAIEVGNTSVVVSPGASSIRDEVQDTYGYLDTALKVVNPEYSLDCVPLIRKLVRVNPDMSQALSDTVRLANTGHQVLFDPTVSPEQIDKMREFITNSSKEWHAGAAGINGIINKMFSQLLIGGALSTEWVPNLELDNLEGIRFILPEQVRWIIDKNYKGYQPYQKLKNTLNVKNPMKDLRKLNSLQFKYYALNGDTDTPYGHPPYMAALDAIKTQQTMIDNIKFIVQCLGILGYIDAKIVKPDRESGESDQAYISRLTGFLNSFKDRVKSGIRDGVTVGFMDDHEYEFHQTAKTAQGVTELFDQNEQLVGSGLGYDTAFMGRQSSETVVTILFMKMIAQLTNIQDIVAENLEFGYKLALKLGGFKFKTLKVRFKKSTITDELKYQQAEEIKLRNGVVKYQFGIISQEQFADELGYDAPDQKEPRIDINNVDPQSGAVKKEKREEGKDKSARSSRAKSKPGAVRRTKPAKNA